MESSGSAVGMGEKLESQNVKESKNQNAQSQNKT
jgi:hypothetical protein